MSSAAEVLAASGWQQVEGSGQTTLLRHEGLGHTVLVIEAEGGAEAIAPALVASLSLLTPSGFKPQP